MFWLNTCDNAMNGDRYGDLIDFYFSPSCNNVIMEDDYGFLSLNTPCFLYLSNIFESNIFEYLKPLNYSKNIFYLI